MASHAPNADAAPDQAGLSPRTGHDLSSPTSPRATPSADLAGTTPQRPMVLRDFGPYEILEVVAQGGMGVVYKARDTRLNRVVALKTIRAGAEAGLEILLRFQREAQAAGRLAHRHIVPIYETGQHNGEPYFTMPFIPGGSLKDHRDRFRGDPKAAVALVEKVARAVQAAHQQGIVHRDLKPANILLDEHGEPLVGDFGVAKFLDAVTDLTQTGQPLGTPQYMAPEQLAGQGGRVGVATDVWALGVILYELLAGQRPFLGATRDALARQILTAEPALPGPDAALDQVVLHCLEKEPAQRYSSAEALADDLARWRDGQLVRAPSVGLAWHFRRGWQALWRRPAVLAVAALALALLAGLALLPRGSQLSPEESAALRRKAALEAIRRQLAAGQTVSLLDAAGRPVVARWALGEAAFSKPPAGEAACAFHAFQLSLLELLPELPLGRYRFSAEICHLDGATETYAGIYFFYGRQPNEWGVHHGFWELCCAEDWRPVPNPLGGWVGLRLHTYSEPGPGKGGNDIGQTRLQERFSSVRRDEGTPWRPLAVEVTPEAIRVFWDKKELPSSPLSWADVRKRVVRHSGVTPALHGLVPDCSPRGGLGLILNKGAAAFRSVELKPLPSAE